jgi:hypothetical protein
MPLVANPRKATTDLIGELLAEFVRPLPHGFVLTMMPRAASNSLHHAETKRKREIKPCGMADNLGRKPNGAPYVRGSRNSAWRLREGRLRCSPPCGAADA